MTNYTLMTAGRDTHFEVITVSLILSIVAAWLAIATLG